MKRYLIYVLLLAVVVSMSSCRRAVEKAQRNIRFEGIEVERQGLTGAEVVVRVMNNTGYKLVLDAANREIHAGGRGSVVLRERSYRAGRTVSGPWRLKISDRWRSMSWRKAVGRLVAGCGVVCRRGAEARLRNFA